MPLARKQLERRGIDSSRLVFIDDAPAAELVNGHSVLTYDEFIAQRSESRFVAIAVADSAVREKLAARCSRDGALPWSVRAEDVVVMDDVEIGDGALLSPFVTITSNIRIGKYFHCNLYGYVEHDCTIGDFVTFAPGAKCNGNIVIEDHAYIGSGAVLRQGSAASPLRIGRGAVVGMGAVVTRDVAAGETVVGNPSRRLNKTG
jgi:sugar O-acyltransferase (sialic acid O-acetyltransferase NeuD family)